MTIHQVIQAPRRRLPLVVGRATRLRVFAENAINTYLSDTVDRVERDDRAIDIIDIIRSYVNDVTTPRGDPSSLRNITKQVVRMYLGDGPTQRERMKRADDLVAVVKVYMRREAR